MIPKHPFHPQPFRKSFFAPAAFLFWPRWVSPASNSFPPLPLVTGRRGRGSRHWEARQGRPVAHAPCGELGASGGVGQYSACADIEFPPRRLVSRCARGHWLLAVTHPRDRPLAVTAAGAQRAAGQAAVGAGGPSAGLLPLLPFVSLRSRLPARARGRSEAAMFPAGAGRARSSLSPPRCPFSARAGRAARGGGSP